MVDPREGTASATVIDSAQRKRYSTIAMYAMLLLLATVFVVPLLFMFMSSLKQNTAIFADLQSIRALLPTGDVSFDNYASIFAFTRFERFFVNSLLITFITVMLGLVVNAMAAFALARLEWRGKEFVLSAIIVLLIIPLEAIAIPMLLLVSRLPWVELSAAGLVLRTSWLNSIHVQIVPFVAHAFSIFLFYQFFRDIPKDFDEAAYVDGATPLQVFWKVIVPLSAPVFATVAILQSLAMWNQYLWPVMVVQGESARPVMVGLQQFFGRTTNWGEVMAYASLITLPLLVVFLVFQRWFVQSVAGSGVKG